MKNNDKNAKHTKAPVFAEAATVTHPIAEAATISTLACLELSEELSKSKNIAVVATNSVCCSSEYTKMIEDSGINGPRNFSRAVRSSQTKRSAVINFQLDKWNRAKKIFHDEIIPSDNPSPESMLEVVSQLAESISTLFSRVLKSENAPYLRNCPEKLKKKRGWNIEIEKPELCVMLNEMNKFYNAEKHYDESKEELVRIINKEKVIDFMEKTRLVWLWILDKFFKGNIPADQLTEFKETFGK